MLPSPFSSCPVALSVQRSGRGIVNGTERVVGVIVGPYCLTFLLEVLPFLQMTVHDTSTV